MGVKPLGVIKASNFDTSNIPGYRLAEIGRLALLGEQIVKESNPFPGTIEGDYTDIGWLDRRIQEICDKGRL